MANAELLYEPYIGYDYTKGPETVRARQGKKSVGVQYRGSLLEDRIG